MTDCCRSGSAVASYAPMRQLTALFLACIAFCLPKPLEAQQDNAEISIIPRPAKLTTGTGQFTLTPATTIWVTSETAALGRRLARYLEPATGFDLAVRTTGTPTGNRIVLRLDSALARLGDEGYTLDVAPGVVSLRAAKPAGLFYSIQSLRQILPVEIFREAPVTGVAWVGACASHRGFAALRVARNASRRWPAFHAQGVRQEVHRSPRAP